MQRWNEKFFTLFSKAGSNGVESAAILMEFVAAPHERWAKLAKHMLDTEHAGDDTTQVVDPGQGGCRIGVMTQSSQRGSQCVTESPGEAVNEAVKTPVGPTASRE